MNAEKPLLEADGLTVLSGTRRVVGEISITLSEKERIAFIGASGAGKTLASRALLLRDLPEGFSSTFRRLSWKGSPASKTLLFKETRFIFQDPEVAFAPHLSIAEQIEDSFSGDLKKLGGAWDLLRSMSLEKAAFDGRYPGQLSGGQKQRLMIALAAAKNPELLVADEITSNLDPVSALEALETLKQAAGTAAVLLISHNLAHARRIAGRIAVFLNGLIVEDGPAEEVLSEPKHPYTRMFVAGKTGVTLRAGAGQGCVFAADCGEKIPGCEKEAPAVRNTGKSRVLCRLYDR